jgi:hypothetical protein
MRSARLLVLATAIAAMAVFVATAAATTAQSGALCKWLTAAQVKAVLGANGTCQLGGDVNFPTAQGPTWDDSWTTSTQAATISLGILKPSASQYAKALVATKRGAAKHKPPVKNIGLGTWAGVYEVVPGVYHVEMFINGYSVGIEVSGIRPLKSLAPMIALAKEVAPYLFKSLPAVTFP